MKLGNKTLISLFRWFDSESGQTTASFSGDRFDWLRCLPFVAAHLACLAVFWVGWNLWAVVIAMALYLVRMFAITGFYHRYFSHRSFRSSRFMQFIFAVAGSTAVQRGPLWWAAHHRNHHRHSDEERDVHSPVQRGFIWSHFLWFTSGRNFYTDYSQVKDLTKFPELRFLNRFDWLVPVLFAVSIYSVGLLLNRTMPQLGVTGPQLLVWGFFISRVALWHGTFTINSLAHIFGKRVYETKDSSRNNWFLALITLGEGWHNNHHRFPGSVRQGFLWWEFDPTYYLLKLMAWLGLIWDLKQVPTRVVRERRKQ